MQVSFGYPHCYNIKGTCIVNAYCQFSQQACTNFIQTYLYLLIPTHFFILTTNLHYSNIMQFGIKSVGSIVSYRPTRHTTVKTRLKRIATIEMNLIPCSLKAAKVSFMHEKILVPGQYLLSFFSRSDGKYTLLFYNIES